MRSEKKVSTVKEYPLTQEDLKPFELYENENGCVCLTSELDGKVLCTWIYVAPGHREVGYSRWANINLDGHNVKLREFHGGIALGNF